ncbi:hypothetical protein JQ604_11260 [Bradyrhizobium jicamae]|uniref:hypothetical protein n=1 Tax=Bradyrhizobium jicamae TaxID=280332 RepID=UPI001BAB282C|nr:hypothetical protein [Bradyrhizobium jicamae]MBR0752764.1 hypothetical protein [Bradyrhizobium jicamae]
MTNNFSFQADRRAVGSHALKTLEDAALAVISGGGDTDKSWRNDYHFCANGSAGGGRPGLYPLYIKCK